MICELIFVGGLEEINWLGNTKLLSIYEYKA